MPRGRGSLQWQVLAALMQRAQTDVYDLTKVPELSDYSVDVRVRARWRWYTIDLLDLADRAAAETKRASLHNAVKTLAHGGHLQTAATRYPYERPFAPYRDEHGDYVGGVDLAELSHIDPRWPGRRSRRLWFRLPSPAKVPPDDQIAVLNWLGVVRPDSYEEFAGTVDRRQAWESAVGRFLRWLLCGPSRRNLA